MTAMKEMPSLLGLKMHKLVIDVSTHWNSSVDMITRQLEQQVAVLEPLLLPDIKKNLKEKKTSYFVR